MPRHSTASGFRDRYPGSQSRSPYRDSRHHSSHQPSRRPRSRSRSPLRDGGGREPKKRHRSRSPPPRPVALPYNAKQLHRSQFDEYKPLFQSYLDIQKQIHLEDLDEREAKGRWKSFVGRWNRGDLARSWYDPSMLKTAKETVASYRRSSPDYTPAQEGASDETKPLSESETEDFGPVPLQNTDNRRAGPTVPRLGDLDHRNELREEDRARERSDYIDDIRYERKVDRKAQKERLEEYMPRADPGSRERQLEKKRETTSTLKDFRDAKEGGDAEMAEADVMGDDGIEVYKRKKMETERKKTEREIRKEEVFRAKAAEREERLAERRAKEASTMEYFQKLAKERFG